MAGSGAWAWGLARGVVAGTAVGLGVGVAALAVAKLSWAGLGRTKLGQAEAVSGAAGDVPVREVGSTGSLETSATGRRGLVDGGAGEGEAVVGWVSPCRVGKGGGAGMKGLGKLGFRLIDRWGTMVIVGLASELRWPCSWADRGLANCSRFNRACWRRF